MHFARPQFLWLLWLLPPLLALFWVAARRSREALARFADPALWDRVAPAARGGGARWLRGSLLLSALVLFVLALAGPRWGFRWEEVKRRGVDLVIALDLSRSMLAQDFKPDRLTVAKRELRDLLDLLQGDRVALVVFAGTAFVQVPLTLDYGAFEVFLDQLDPDWVPVGGTDLAAAVRAGIGAFPEGERRGRAMLLLTDGEDHSGELEKAGAEAKEQGVHVFVVGVGAPEGAPIPDGRGGFVKEDGRVVLSRLGEDELKALALGTGGTYVRSVAGDMDLRQVYLTDVKGTLEARQLASSRQKRWEERFQWLLLPALLLVLLESVLRPRKRGALAAPLAAAVALALLAAPGTASAGWLGDLLGGDDPRRLGRAAYDAGRFDEALQNWVSAQVQDPGDPRIDYDIGLAHYRLQHWADAEKAFREAAATDEPELAADGLYNAGNAAFQQGRFLEAVGAYEGCLEIREDDEDCQYNRDLAQRKYEEMLERAQEQQEQQQKPEEQDQEREQQQQDPQQDDAQAQQQPPEQDGPPSEQQQDGPPGEGEQEQQKKKEQQEGRGASRQEAEAEQQKGQGPQPSEEEQPEPDENEGAGEGERSEAEQQQAEAQEAARAAAADLDRDGVPDAQEDSPRDGALGEATEPGQADTRPQAVVDGALSQEEAEGLLRALEADQARRREERTEREGKRGRRAAGKDW
jgi:Ca-activated chloride channel family protein